jgi:hypothetical protein
MRLVYQSRARPAPNSEIQVHFHLSSFPKRRLLEHPWTQVSRQSDGTSIVRVVDISRGVARLHRDLRQFQALKEDQLEHGALFYIQSGENLFDEPGRLGRIQIDNSLDVPFRKLRFHGFEFDLLVEMAQA